LLLDGSEIVTTLYADDSVNFIWLLGNNSIGLVNPKTMVYDLVPNFFGNPNEEIIPFTAIACPKTRKLAGLYMNKSEIYVVFVKPGGKLIRKKQSDILGPSNLY
jgi:hypothetical protein